MRLIDADALIKAVEKGEGISWERYGKDTVCVRKKYIDNAPIVESNCEGCTTWSKSTELLKKRLSYLARPKGEWNDLCVETGLHTFYYACSVCGSEPFGNHRSDFCPNCGADMRGETGNGS